ncbi:unnamed protein product [Symbiodinium pilosum]|uniref:Integrase catalytic domain-containing protein n=1 Tax=Symbiodinium pilosum TaxID=2952 RepID=A0A812QNA1_SYMPI|nr:unnamed protein product [Symbiodinium pilosum]
MDEASDYQVATIVRSGTSKQGSVSSEEFKTALAKDWLRILPKPGNIRFDDEGAFRDQKLIEWIEAQAIRVSVIAGEAAWQVGKHSRHLEVLKENMSLLSSEVGPQAKAEELLALSLASKNEMHNVQGYSPNQWVFGQDKTRVQSFLQNGDNMATSSLRDRNESFESSLEKAHLARQTFLKADSRRRILRAARGRARKSQSFEVGQLVYFYRKGRNNTSRHEAGWHGPARVLAIEKQGSTELNQTQGSVIWVVHATVLYRCAPEQLRIEPEDSETHEHEPQVRGLSSSNAKQNAINLLEKMSNTTKKKTAESTVTVEINRLEALNLRELGEVFSEKADYLKWLIEHHENNPKYLNVIWYAKRQPSLITRDGSESQSRNDSEFRTDRQQTPSGVSSQNAEEILTELAQERGLVRDDQGQTLTLKQVYEACQQQVATLKERIDLLEQTNQVYQQTMYQFHGQILYLQEHLEDALRRLAAAEAAQNRERQ